jgi:hypothetical protein
MRPLFSSRLNDPRLSDLIAAATFASAACMRSIVQ